MLSKGRVLSELVIHCLAGKIDSNDGFPFLLALNTACFSGKRTSNILQATTESLMSAIAAQLMFMSSKSAIFLIHLDIVSLK